MSIEKLSTNFDQHCFNYCFVQFYLEYFNVVLLFLFL